MQNDTGTKEKKLSVSHIKCLRPMQNDRRITQERNATKLTNSFSQKFYLGKISIYSTAKRKDLRGILPSQFFILLSCAAQ